MKILLFGEFSSFHMNLKEGLQELGHQAIVAGDVDGFKKIPVDISFERRLPSIFGKIESRIRKMAFLRDASEYDVVQIINPFVFGKYFPKKYYIKKIIERNSKVFLAAAGSDAYYWRYGDQRLRYTPFKEWLKYDLKKEVHYMQSSEAFEFNQEVAQMVSGVIPVMYDYEVCYSDLKNRLPTIPLPINTRKILYQDNIVKSKLVVFHGLTRYGFKGTRHVEKAFEVLGHKYPNDLELVIDGNMPLKKYLGLLSRTNVVIDQLNSYSCGMNGLYALAMGKVVVGGAEPESLVSLGMSGSPVINVTPSPQSIIAEVVKILDQRASVPQIGYESRIFAEKFHSHIKVAQSYLDVWRSIAVR